jgi:hypothetical protein
MTLQDLLSTFRRLWSAVVSHERSYGCLPDDPSDTIEKPASNHPGSANSVEKEKPLR